MLGNKSGRDTRPNIPPSQATTVDEGGGGDGGGGDQTPGEALTSFIPGPGLEARAPSPGIPLPFYYSRSGDSTPDSISDILTLDTHRLPPQEKFFLAYHQDWGRIVDMGPRLGEPLTLTPTSTSTPTTTSDTPREGRPFTGAKTQTDTNLPQIWAPRPLIHRHAQTDTPNLSSRTRAHPTRDVGIGNTWVQTQSDSTPAQVRAPKPLAHRHAQTDMPDPGPRTCTHFGTQTEPTTPQPGPHSRIQPILTRTTLFPPSGGTNDRRAPTHQRPPIVIQVTSDPNVRLISFPQEDDQDSLATTNSVDALLEQVRTLMTDAARFEVRAKHLEEMNEREILAPWATGVQPYPPFIQNNARLLGKIRDVRKEAALRIQEIVHADFDRQSTRLQTEGETLISTIEGLMKGKTSALTDARLEHAATLVGKSKADLTTKLYNRREFLAQRQPTMQDWDNFFRYSGAYRKYKINQVPEFTVSPRDRRQADREDEEEIRRSLRDDDVPEAAASNQPRNNNYNNNNNKKRKRDQPAASASGPYRIPRKTERRHTDHSHNQRRYDDDQHWQEKGRREYRDTSPPRNSRRNQDFVESRPTATHKSTYYRSDHEGRRGRGNHQDKGPSGTHPHQRRERDQEDRDQQLQHLQQQLDRLRRA